MGSRSEKWVNTLNGNDLITPPPHSLNHGHSFGKTRRSHRRNQSEDIQLTMIEPIPMFKTHRHVDTQSEVAHAEFTSTQDENGIDSEYEQMKDEITPAPQNEIDIDVPYAIDGGENRKDADMELMENVN